MKTKALFIALGINLILLSFTVYKLYTLDPPVCPEPVCPDMETVIYLESLDWEQIQELECVHINWNPVLQGDIHVLDATARATKQDSLATDIFIYPSGQATK